MFTRTGSPAAARHSRRWSARPLLTAVVCAAFLAAAQAAAHAEIVRDRDPAGDMVTFDDEDAVVLVPERRLNDVSTTRLRHGARRIAVRVDFVGLRKKAGGDYQRLGILMVTDEEVRRYVSLDAWRGHWSGRSQMYDGKHAALRCAVRHSIDYDADVVKVSFPRRCASGPRWVVFRVWAQSNGEDGYYADDALRDRPISSQAGHMKRSDRVHRPS